VPIVDGFEHRGLVTTAFNGKFAALIKWAAGLEIYKIRGLTFD
jgi:hypothetical protein